MYAICVCGTVTILKSHFSFFTAYISYLFVILYLCLIFCTDFF
jgi:hypothetical protein